MYLYVVCECMHAIACDRRLCVGRVAAHIDTAHRRTDTTRDRARTKSQDASIIISGSSIAPSVQMSWGTAEIESFWRAAVAGARLPSSAEANELQRCPKTFMYVPEKRSRQTQRTRSPLHKLLLGDSPTSDPRDIGLFSSYGPTLRYSSRLRISSQYSFGAAFTRRLWRSPCRTDDPSEAELFFVPIQVRKKFARRWQDACAWTARELGPDLGRHLPHLCGHRGVEQAVRA